MQAINVKTLLGYSWMALLMLASTISSTKAADDHPILAAWVQLTAYGFEARAVVLGDCPDIQLDRQTVTMNIRAEPSIAHPNTVCSVDIEDKIKRIELAGQQLPVPVKRPRQLVIVGDTGCRLSDSHGLYQACDNTSTWPFAQAVAAIAATNPELVIHTGDYIYREAACPEGNNGCIGSPHGDNMETWMADWLDPAKPLFAAAPIVAVRGNHETCKRAGVGWFRYLGARANPPQCLDSTESWVADLGYVQLGIIDSANLKDADGNPLTDHFARQLTAISNQVNGNTWVTAHHPFWGVGADDDSGELVTYTDVLQAAVAQAGLPTETQLLLGSHIHLVEVLDFNGVQPPQLVVGNGGTQLVNRITPPDDVNGLPIAMSKILYQYGFTTMTAQSSRHWNLDLLDIEGTSIGSCRLSDKRMRCELQAKQCKSLDHTWRDDQTNCSSP